jgi:hypothetical protein
MSAGLPANCSGLAYLGGADETSERGDCSPRTSLLDHLRQPKIDEFRRDRACVSQTHHDIRWFDVPVNKLLLVNCGQTSCELSCNLQRESNLQPTRASDEALEGLSFNKLHRVEVMLTRAPQMEDRGNIWMPNAGRRARLAHETKARGLVANQCFTDDFQSHWTSQTNIKRLVIPIPPRPSSSGLPSAPATSS